MYKIQILELTYHLQWKYHMMDNDISDLFQSVAP